MPRFYCPMPLAAGQVLDLPPGAARHVQVLRMQPGHSLELFNHGPGWDWGQQAAPPSGQFSAEITAMGRNQVQVRVLAHQAQEREAAWAIKTSSTEHPPSGSLVDPGPTGAPGHALIEGNAAPVEADGGALLATEPGPGEAAQRSRRVGRALLGTESPPPVQPGLCHTHRCPLHANHGWCHGLGPPPRPPQPGRGAADARGHWERGLQPAWPGGGAPAHAPRRG